MDGRPDLASGPLKIGKLNVLNAIFNLIIKFSVDCKNVFAGRYVQATAMDDA